MKTIEGNFSAVYSAATDDYEVSIPKVAVHFQPEHRRLSGRPARNQGGSEPDGKPGQKSFVRLGDGECEQWERGYGSAGYYD